MLGIAPRPTTDGKELLDGFFSRATWVDLEISEGIEETLRSTQPLPRLAKEWLRDMAAEVPFTISELRSATHMFKHLKERRATSAEMETDFVEVLAPVSAVDSEAIVELRGLFARLPAEDERPIRGLSRALSSPPGPSATSVAAARQSDARGYGSGRDASWCDHTAHEECTAFPSSYTPGGASQGMHGASVGPSSRCDREA